MTVFSMVGFQAFSKISLFKVCFSFQRTSCSQVLAFQLNGCIPAYNSQKQVATVFFKKTVFLQNLILELFNEIVSEKELQLQPPLKMNSFKGMFLKFCYSNCLSNKQNTYIYFTEHIVTSTLIIQRVLFHRVENRRVYVLKNFILKSRCTIVAISNTPQKREKVS